MNFVMRKKIQPVIDSVSHFKMQKRRKRRWRQAGMEARFCS